MDITHYSSTLTKSLLVSVLNSLFFLQKEKNQTCQKLENVLWKKKYNMNPYKQMMDLGLGCLSTYSIYSYKKKLKKIYNG